MVRDLLEQQMAIEDAAADAAVAATPGLNPTSAAGSAVKYARAVGRGSPGRTEWSECCAVRGMKFPEPVYQLMAPSSAWRTG